MALELILSVNVLQTQKKKGFREKGVAKSSGEVMRGGRCLVSLEDFGNGLRPINVPGLAV